MMIPHIIVQKENLYPEKIFENKHKPTPKTSKTHKVASFMYLDIKSLSKKLRSDNPKYSAVITTPKTTFPNNIAKDENEVIHKT